MGTNVYTPMLCMPETRATRCFPGWIGATMKKDEQVTMVWDVDESGSLVLRTVAGPGSGSTRRADGLDK
jgi:hypothetical protein